MTLTEFLGEELRNFYRDLPKSVQINTPKLPPVVTTSIQQLSAEDSQKFIEQRIAQKAADPNSTSNAIPV